MECDSGGVRLIVVAASVLQWSHVPEAQRPPPSNTLFYLDCIRARLNRLTLPGWPHGKPV